VAEVAAGGAGQGAGAPVGGEDELEERGPLREVEAGGPSDVGESVGDDLDEPPAERCDMGRGRFVGFCHGDGGGGC
jgi:hypothetical protein